MPSKILVVDDEELIRWSISEDLARAGYKTHSSEDLASAVRALEKDAPDVVLTDLRLGADSGLDVLREARRLCPGVPVVLMTGFADVSTAVEALREGAADYISKPLQLEGLKITLQRVLEAATMKNRLQQAHQKRRDRYSLDTIVAASPSMAEAVDLARKIAASPSGTVLILGESGCGKDRLARAIHFESARASQPLMEISCTAIPEHLLESELFGHEKGAFTDAARQKKGLFELSDGGTVFLNEIGHMPLGLQGKILRFLEDKTFKRVGGSEDIVVDVRIVAATNEDLERAVAEKRFRSDLYYRVNVLTVRLLPLRQRREDIAPLVDVLLSGLCRELVKPRPQLPPETLAAMLAYSWPGNVRELRNILERMLILGETQFRPGPAPEFARPAPGAPGASTYPLPDGGVRLEEVEKSLIEQALKLSGGKQQKAAQLLGLSRDALRRRLEKFGLKLAALALLTVLATLPARGAPDAGGKTAKTSSREVVFPPPPDEARIRWVRSIAREGDLSGRGRGGFWRKLIDMLTGKQGEELALARPYGVSVLGEKIFVADTESSSVVVFDKAKGSIERVGAGAQGRLTSPIGVSVDSSSRVFVTDSAADIVKAYGADGTVLWQVGALGKGAGALKKPTGIAVGRRGDVLVADTGNARIVSLSAESGAYLGEIGRKGSGDGELAVPTNLWVERDGTVLVTDTILCRVSAFGEDGRFLFGFGSCGDIAGYLSRPRGVASDSDGNIYVVDALFDAVQIFDRSGKLLLFFGGHGGGPADFQLPAGLFIDPSDHVWVVDSFNRRIQEFEYLKKPAR